MRRSAITVLVAMSALAAPLPASAQADKGQQVFAAQKSSIDASRGASAPGPAHATRSAAPATEHAYLTDLILAPWCRRTAFHACDGLSGDPAAPGRRSR